MRYITIALAKGRLAKKAMEIFEQIGIPWEEVFMKYMTFRWANAECVYVVLNQQEKSYSIMSL